MLTPAEQRLRIYQAWDRIDDSFARLHAADVQISRLDDMLGNAAVMTLDEFNESIRATGLLFLTEMQRKPGTGHRANVRYRDDVRYVVDSILHGDVTKIDDVRVDRGFNDAVPAVTAAWVEVNEHVKAKAAVMSAERIAELTSRETP